MEKLGISWFSSSVSPASSGLSHSDSPSASKEVIKPSKEAPKKQAVKQQETIKIGGKKNQVPSYQKKCC